MQKRKTGQLLIAELDRRKFLSHGITALGATWTAAHWPALLAAAEHAHHVVLFPEDQKWEFFTAAEAKEVEALASCIIPNDGTPGAREAGVVYFIDRALVTFSYRPCQSGEEPHPAEAHFPDFARRGIPIRSGLA